MPRLDPLRAAAREGRQAYARALAKATTDDPTLARVLPFVLYETLGPTLPRAGPGRPRCGVWRSASR